MARAVWVPPSTETLTLMGSVVLGSRAQPTAVMPVVVAVRVSRAPTGGAFATVMARQPTEGLSPKMVEHIGQFLEEIAGRGVAILLVEQKLTIALKISKRLYVMGHGKIVYEGTPAELEQASAIRKEWLEV